MAVSDDELRDFLADEPEPAHINGHGHDAITDLVIAELLIDTHGKDLHYCHPWNAWLAWQGHRWEQDAAGWADHLTKTILRQLLQDAAQIDDDKTRHKRIRDLIAAEKASRVAGALQLARSEPGIPIQPDDLDADPWLFNLPNGTLNLKTSSLQTHRAADLITRTSPAPHDPEANCPTWHTFLQRCIPDPETQQFVQRAAGYSMVGGNPAQILLILYGSGANGKSTFIETIRRLFGDYGQQAPPETFLATRDHIPNDVARLRGTRFVAATEIGEGRRLNEPLIKRMTGGDTMTARFMRAEYFEFQPMFTPWLATNHRPEIKGTDEAIWRRIRLIPFTETIPPKERDDQLPAKLTAELPGILNWAIAGCEGWQHDGLAEPAAVQAATAEYRDAEDDIGRFIQDRCQTNETHTELAGNLWHAWQEWAREQGADPLSAKALGLRLAARGMENGKTSRGRVWKGIRLETDQQNLET